MKTLFKVKSVNPVMGPTQAVVVFRLMNVELAQNPPISAVSLVKKYPQHENCETSRPINSAL